MTYFFTQTIKDNPNPVFMERFLIPVEPDLLDAKQVQFQVYSCDKYARHKLLGETDLRVGDIDLRQPIRVWMNLRDMDEVGGRLSCFCKKQLVRA